jgi:hypothetical protein
MALSYATSGRARGLAGRIPQATRIADAGAGVPPKRGVMGMNGKRVMRSRQGILRSLGKSQ